MAFFLRTLWGVRHIRWLFIKCLYDCDNGLILKRGNFERLYQRHARLECVWNGWE